MKTVLGVNATDLTSLMVFKLFFVVLWWDFQIGKTRLLRKCGLSLNWFIKFYDKLNENASIKAVKTKNKWTFNFSAPRMCAIRI